MQCYTKNEFWAECRESCTKGPDPTDQSSSDKWDCDELGPRAPGQAMVCAADGEDCHSSKCCKVAGTTCFAKDEYFAMCMPSCTPGLNMASKEPEPWACTSLGPQAHGAAPWVQEKCAAEGADCRDQMCCKDAGHTCYKKSDFWAQCKASCTKGELSPAWDPAPWACDTLGSMTPASAAGQAAGGVVGGWVEDQCVDAGKDCLQAGCCKGVGMTCFSRDEAFGTCMTACPDTKIYGNESWSCQAHGPKSWGLAVKGWPSLYCFSVMRVEGYEPGLMREQAKAGAGIFACDGYEVLANGVISMGIPMGEEVEVKTIQIPTIAVGVSQDGTAANTLLFMKVWDKIIKKQRFRNYDWTLKVDPDAVLHPVRMRAHMKEHNGENVYVVNCNKVPGSPNFPMMFGAVEVFSNSAMDAYAAGSGKCGKDFWPSWQQWGEDYFMTHCLDHLGVGRISDFNSLGDNMCLGAHCEDGAVAAFHPFKSVGDWMGCWNQGER